MKIRILILTGLTYLMTVPAFATEKLFDCTPELDRNAIRLQLTLKKPIYLAGNKKIDSIVIQEFQQGERGEIESLQQTTVETLQKSGNCTPEVATGVLLTGGDGPGCWVYNIPLNAFGESTFRVHYAFDSDSTGVGCKYETYLCVFHDY